VIEKPDLIEAGV